MIFTHRDRITSPSNILCPHSQMIDSRGRLLFWLGRIVFAFLQLHKVAIRFSEFNGQYHLGLRS